MYMSHPQNGLRTMIESEFPYGKVLVLTVGLPRSGKSTWAMKQGHPIVNPDSIRLALHGQPFIKEAEPFVWATAKVMVASLFIAGHDRVILDATNVTEKRREAWKNPLWVRRYEVFEVDTKVCIERLEASDFSDEHKAGVLDAIHRMAENWEKLLPLELDLGE